MKIQKLLFACTLFLISFVFVQTSIFAKDEWLQVRSKNFNLIGNAPEKDIRKVATKLEQFRETFQKVFTGLSFNSTIPTNVIVFKSGDSYKPFKPKRADGKIDNFIAGYFQPGEDVNYITLSTEGEDADTYGTIFHEYVHFIVNTNYGKSEVPPWFNEGLAEYYQTFDIKEDQKVSLGYPQKEQLALLSQTKLIPLDTLFKISNYALHQNGNHSRSIFYAESWALIHYLIQSGKGESLGKFMALLLKDVAPEKAFQDVFQISYAQMEKDLGKYVEQNSYKYQTLTFKNKLLFDTEMQTSPLSEGASNAYLGDLLYHTNRADDAEPFLVKAVTLAPDSSMANTTLGMLKIRQRKYDDAKKYLEKAISEDQKNHLAFYRYAYLLSRENQDEYGMVSKFSPEQAARMRDLLKKAIAIAPAFTESYELLAFVNLVNSEQLDEAVSYLRTALKYQPGNQRYAMRIADIYMRQDKFAEAAAVVEKIAKTADDPELKSRAENLVAQINQRQEMKARQDAYEKQYGSTNTPINAPSGGSSIPVLTRRKSNENQPPPEEIAKFQEDERLFFVNQSINKPAANEKQLIGQIQKIECKGKNIFYTIRSNNETFTLSSQDFQGLSVTAHVADTDNLTINCGAKIDDFNSVLTYRAEANAKGANRGELTGIDFVPKNFRFMDTSKPLNNPFMNSQPEASDTQEIDAERREAMNQRIKRSLRKPLADEKQEIAYIEKVECTQEGMHFYFKTQTQTIKLSAASPQSIQIRGFTPEIQQIRFGCNLRDIDVPAVITYTVDTGLKAKSYGNLIAMEFVPKNFVLEK